MATPFVGREVELAALTADLEAALAGRGGVVLVAGEPIGKTAGRGAGRPGQRAAYWCCGVAAGRGRCARVLAVGPAGPRLCPDKRPGGAAPGDGRWRGRHRPDRADRPACLPDCRHRCRPSWRRPGFRLFDSAAQLPAGAAARRLLLVLDDLHWADAPSLALLRLSWSGAGGTPSLLVVGIYRHTEVDRGHPLAGTLADLTRGQRHRRLLLGGLDQAEVASFVALVAGAAPSAALAVAVHQQTDGNPFFVTEVVRLLASQGRLDHTEAGSLALADGLPEGVKAVVTERPVASDGCRAC